MKVKPAVLSLLFVGVIIFAIPNYSEAKLHLVSKIEYAHCQHPKWSYDGKFLSFEVRYVRKRIIEIHILNWVTKEKKVVSPTSLQSGGLGLGVVEEKRGMVARELAWSPKSHKYLFSSNGTGTVYNIYMSGEGPLKSNSKTSNDGQPAWSSNAKYVAFTSARSGKGDLYLLKLGHRLKVKRLTKFSDSTELFPSWSPKKFLQLAFMRHTDQNDKIYLINNIFVPRPKRLTKLGNKVSELNPSWSPDGKYIAFYGVLANGVYNLYLSDLKGNVKILAEDVVKSDQFGPAWSPDGKKIFFVKRETKKQDKIYAIDIKTRKLHHIKTGTYLNNELAVTKRGGKWLLAFTSQGTKPSAGLVYRKLYVKELKPLP